MCWPKGGPHQAIGRCSFGVNPWAGFNMQHRSPKTRRAWGGSSPLFPWKSVACPHFKRNASKSLFFSIIQELGYWVTSNHSMINAAPLSDRPWESRPTRRARRSRRRLWASLFAPGRPRKALLPGDVGAPKRAALSDLPPVGCGLTV